MNIWKSTVGNKNDATIVEAKDVAKEILSSSEKDKKPIILFFPGNDVTDNDLFDANGDKNSAAARSLLGFMGIISRITGDTGLKKKTETFVVSYSSNESASDSKRIFKFKSETLNNYDLYSSPYARNIAETIFLPLIANQNVSGNVISWSLKNDEEIIDNLSRITVLSHSFGSIFAAEVSNYLRKSLVNNGVDKAKANTIISSIYHLGIGDVYSYHHKKEAGFSGISVMALNDESSEQIVGSDMQQDLENQKLSLVKINNRMAIYGYISDTMSRWKKTDGSINYISQEENIRGHSFIFYTKLGIKRDDNNVFPKLISNVLRNMVFRKPGFFSTEKWSPEKLLRETMEPFSGHSAALVTDTPYVDKIRNSKLFEITSAKRI